MKDISVITGGAGGMGKAIAQMLGKKSALVLVGRSEKRLQSAKDELDYLGMESYIRPADCSKREDMDSLAEYAASLGNVKNVINTAAIDPAGNVGRDIANINVNGVVNVMRAFYPVVGEKSVLMTFASIATYHAPGILEPYYDGGENYSKWEAHPVYDRWDEPNFGEIFYQAVREGMGKDFDEDSYELAGLTYCASKRFTNVFTRRNVKRFADRGCRLLCIIPGCYLTPMHQGMIDTQTELVKSELEAIPLKRWGHPYEMADLINFLCSDEAAFINGVEILADGGQMASIKTPQIA